MVNENKTKVVQQLINNIKTFPLVGVVNLENLPAQQLQQVRSMLRSKGVKINMAKKRLLNLALTESHLENIEKLSEKATKLAALIFAQENPFALYSVIQENKSEAPAKAGQIALKDIIVKAGPTSFAPGPIISELASVGIKTKVENGKLAIIQDVTVAKEGEVISSKLADTLKRLDIKPMEIGLNLVAVWENGIVFEGRQLRLDKEEYLQNIVSAAQWAMNLALEAVILNDETTELLVQKAFNEAKALSLDQDILADLTAEEILAKVERQALSLKDTAHLEVSATKKVVSEKKDKPKPVIVEKPLVIEREVQEVIANDKKNISKETVDEASSEEILSSEEKLSKESHSEESQLITETFQKEAQIAQTELPLQGLSPQIAQKQSQEQTQKNYSQIVEGHLPSARSLIEETKKKFSTERKAFNVSESISPNVKVTAESLVAEELDLAEDERKRREKTELKKDHSVEEAEHLFEKLKQKGTLR